MTDDARTDDARTHDAPILDTLSWLQRRLADERGEGVISTAIAVLIMALIGAAMWTAFNTLFEDASTKVADNVEQIG